MFNDTFKNNITLGERYSEHEIQEAIRISGLYPLVSHLDDGVNTLIEENGENFSGGERQRIALCRAILRKADIYLLDEADSGIDKDTLLLILDELKKLDNTMLIVISHRREVLEHFKFDHVLSMQEGRLIENLM